MRKTLVLCILFIASSAFAERGITTNITDGDTIKVFLCESGGEVTLRFFGIDAPEKNQPFGAAATEELACLLLDREVEVEILGKSYRRFVALVWATDYSVLYNAAMVDAGLAWVDNRYCKSEVCNQWRIMQTTAQKVRVGLWSQDDPEPPWEYRKRRHKKK